MPAVWQPVTRSETPSGDPADSGPAYSEPSRSPQRQSTIFRVCARLGAGTSTKTREQVQQLLLPQEPPKLPYTRFTTPFPDKDNVTVARVSTFPSDHQDHCHVTAAKLLPPSELHAALHVKIGKQTIPTRQGFIGLL